MATVTISKIFEPNQVDNAAPETIYTLSAPYTATKNGRVRFTNTTATAATISAWMVPSGGSAGDSNKFLFDKSIAANDYLDIDLPDMKQGDFFQAQAGTATAITVHSLGGVLYS